MQNVIDGTPARDHRPVYLRRAPKLTPTEVHGFTIGSQARPDRVFHVLQRGPTFDTVWEVEGYCAKEPETGRALWRLILVCPTCDRSLTIDSQKKAIEVDSGLEVEPFSCSWPGDFGQSQCAFSAGIRLPKGEGPLVGVDGLAIPVRIDGVFVRA